MKICIVGAGAIGGMLGVKIAQAGGDVSVVDQGVHLGAMRRDGLRLVMADGTESATQNIRFSDSTQKIGPVDFVILGVKAHQIAGIASQLPHLYSSRTVVITIQNGIPWWYFQSHGGPLEGACLQTLDPSGVISKYISPERILGGVAYPACAMPEPGVVRHIEGNRFAIGELDGSLSDRAKHISALLNSSGFKSYVVENIRAEIWLKAWGALAFNPISALTQATMVEMCQCPKSRELAATMMKEAREVATKLGISFRHSLEKRIAGAESVGAHKTSMLQDLQAGRSLEVEAVIGSIVELAELTNTECPSIKAVHACASLLDKTVQKQFLTPDHDMNAKEDCYTSAMPA
jgi:2-dehydropantoate 2-reductase